ncbi:HyaD/HybD family hydrogenase maturation endopeptidase [Sulfurimonas paralvinellae]|uniref:Hydrogenase maturation protease n=1 Tax=Sulfurimonas paralvinellae TaxID=317658 RepID=A0A7M1BDB5_9BACT|nr:HyaD/HybD family hydrogenase maturation endopeptidase [Sulfurimonas paralvinellae]QOP46792.1 hydrogenase maturation protease [Sulfurimonas paralvinellae]
MKKTAVLGVGNILELDDGIAVYATKYLENNYSFKPSIDIINGGVEGINLLNLFMEYEHILILDAIEIDDKPGSIYHIPAHELTGYGLNSGGAHEIGVLQCFDILELMGKDIPQSSVVGIIPEKIDVFIGLSQTMKKNFHTYINTVLNILKKENIIYKKNQQTISIENIIDMFKNPSSK